MVINTYHTLLLNSVANFKFVSKSENMQEIPKYVEMAALILKIVKYVHCFFVDHVRIL